MRSHKWILKQTWSSRWICCLSKHSLPVLFKSGCLSAFNFSKVGGNALFLLGTYWETEAKYVAPHKFYIVCRLEETYTNLLTVCFVWLLAWSLAYSANAQWWFYCILTLAVGLYRMWIVWISCEKSTSCHLTISVQLRLACTSSVLTDAGDVQVLHWWPKQQIQRYVERIWVVRSPHYMLNLWC